MGRPSRIALKQTAEKFSVEVDGKLCFDSNKIKLPIGYNFGISAATTENPDSFEVFQFVVTTESHTPDVAGPGQHSGDHLQHGATEQNQQNAPQSPAGQNSNPAFNGEIPDIPAAQIKNSDAQFADLHNRLQAMMKHISALNRDLSAAQGVATTRASKLQADVTSLQSQLSKLDAVAAINTKLDTIQADVRQTKSDLHNALDRHVAGLRNEVRDSHGKVLGHLTSNAPGIMGFLLVVFGSQALLVVAYLLYKKRKGNGHMKYL